MQEEITKEKESSKLKLLSSKLLDSKPKKISGEKEYSEPPLPITLSRKVRWIVFAILIYAGVVLELDQGALSSTTDSLSEDLELNDSQLGGLGSMVFLGKALGCLVFFTLINKLNRKYILLVTSFLTVLSLILTTQTKNVALLYIFRIIAGLSQSFVGIYFPVWNDQFGIHKHKSIFLTIHHLSSALGYLIGYGLGIWLGWDLSFYVQSFLIIIPFIILFFISDKFFSMSLMPLKSKMKLLEKDENKEKESNDKIEKEIKKIKVTVLDDSYQENEENKPLDEETKEEQIDLEDDISLFEDIQQQGEDMSKDSIMLQIKAIIRSPLFILINISLCAIYIIVAAIQFWINDYLQYALKIEDEKTRLMIFGGVIITSPASGMVLGGIILSKVGGYESEKAIYIPLVFSLIVIVFANLAPLSTNAYIFVPLFWIYLFAGSTIIPASNGISLVSVDKKFTGASSSLSILIYNVLGRFPGPNVYAAFKSMVDDDASRIPMWLLLNVSIIAFLSVLIALRFNKKKFIKLREELLNKEKEDEEKNKKNYKNKNNVEEAELLILEGGNKNEEENNKEENSEENIN